MSLPKGRIVSACGKLAGKLKMLAVGRLNKSNRMLQFASLPSLPADSANWSTAPVCQFARPIGTANGKQTPEWLTARHKRSVPIDATPIALAMLYPVSVDVEPLQSMGQARILQVNALSHFYRIGLKVTTNTPILRA